MNQDIKNSILKFVSESKTDNKLYDVETRIIVLSRIKKWILDNLDNITQALKYDLNKTEVESYLSEISIVTNQINFYIKKIKKFFKTKKVSSNAFNSIFSKGYVYYKPIGTSLLINPYNYPFHLTMMPWITNIASGNYTILKNSPKTPNVNKLFKQIISDLNLNSSTIYLEDNTDKNALFEIIHSGIGLVFFTGGQTFGAELKNVCDKANVKIILELGSACPVVVDESANIDEFAKRTVWAKLFNMGQTCIAPNSIYVHKNVYAKALERIQKELEIQYSKNSEYKFAKLIDDQHLKNICATVKAHTNIELKCDLDNLKIEPQIIEVDIDNPILNKEIFGPVLFITKFDNEYSFVTQNYHSLNDALSFYLFSNNSDFIEHIKKVLNFGCLSVNEALIHVNNINLPFGGINKSGCGKYHGYYGLVEFSNLMTLNVGSKLNVRIRYFNKLNKYKNTFKKRIK